jgi:putative ABC transport system permease protein
MGIRKVLGAAPFNLFVLVSLSFTRQIALAFVLACPLAWYVMNQWLSGFEYRTLLQADVFIFAGLIVLALALATVSFHSLKAARFNPVDSLKSE